jgi:CBS domain-containing protein
MQILEIMNINVARIRTGTALHKAAEIAAWSNASDLVVVDENDQFLGVVSEGDMMRAALPKLNEILDAGGIAQEVYSLIEEKGRALAGVAVDEIMIKKPITVSSKDRIHKAAALMATGGIRRLPVVDDGKLVGTVSRADICRAVFS